MTKDSFTLKVEPMLCDLEEDCFPCPPKVAKRGGYIGGWETFPTFTAFDSCMTIMHILLDLCSKKHELSIPVISAYLCRQFEYQRQNFELLVLAKC